MKCRTRWCWRQDSGLEVINSRSMLMTRSGGRGCAVEISPKQRLVCTDQRRSGAFRKAEFRNHRQSKIEYSLLKCYKICGAHIEKVSLYSGCLEAYSYQSPKVFSKIWLLFKRIQSFQIVYTSFSVVHSLFLISLYMVQKLCRNCLLLALDCYVYDFALKYTFFLPRYQG
jgi:hypothetical protein